jgi:RNA polymerase sigma-70 factor, ECF subfamily
MTNIENIWRELSADLRRFILKRTSDESIADDILQDVFVKIHSRIDTLKDIRRLNGWIYQIMLKVQVVSRVKEKKL